MRKVVVHLPTRSLVRLTAMRGEVQNNPFYGDKILINKMLSIEKCHEILSKNNYKLTNAEIKQVREILYLFAEIQITAEKQLKEDEEGDIIL